MIIDKSYQNRYVIYSLIDTQKPFKRVQNIEDLTALSQVMTNLVLLMHFFKPDFTYLYTTYRWMGNRNTSQTSPKYI